jgi:hypothetical protein
MTAEARLVLRTRRSVESTPSVVMLVYNCVFVRRVPPVGASGRVWLDHRIVLARCDTRIVSMKPMIATVANGGAGGERRRRLWSTDEKRRMVAETFEGDASVSIVA